ncbi:MAG: hypothetical protein JWM19_3995 [Actinomycetia bacterium]|nr:hypothetical protein [Actinomycetes bacterium]
MSAIDQAQVSNILNATTPTGTSGAPGSFTGVGGTAMKVRLNSTASTASAAGTEIGSGGGYTTGGQAVPASSTASSAGSSVTVPASSALSWTNSSGGAWSIVSFDLTSSAGTRTWFGNFNGQPVSVAAGNTFQVAVGGITISLS